MNKKKMWSLKYLLHGIQFKMKYPYKSIKENILTEYKSFLPYMLDFISISPIKSKKLEKLELKKGIDIYYRPHTYDLIIINEINILNLYKMRNLGKSKKINIIDIGAQIGAFTLKAAIENKNAQIYSYEPFFENYAILKKNINISKLKKHIHIFQTGIGSKKEKRTLYLDQKNTGGHSLYEKKSKSVEIRTISLKEVFNNNKIKKCDFLKMDCEGAEYEIIYNTPKQYLKRIKELAIEYSENEDIKKLEIYLQKNGFETNVSKNFFPMLFAFKKNKN